jgi:hypothetical protein
MLRKPLQAVFTAASNVLLIPKNQWTVAHDFVLPESWFTAHPRAMVGPLVVSGENGRYFADGSGREVLLVGSHTWSNLQDTGAPVGEFDYSGYLDFLASHGHNFFRMWAWEQGKWGSWTQSGIEFTPGVYVRSGPGEALDGGAKYDLSQFNAAYFTRLRARVVAAGARGMYVSVMLFDGWSIETKDWAYPNPWPGHPYHGSNNINGVNGDVNGDGQGTEVHTLGAGVSAVTELQKAYVRKVMETVNDLDNVLYEVSNESGVSSTAWQYEMVRYVREYGGVLGKQHPVGMTVQWPNGDNEVLMGSGADWISPNGGWGHRDNPPANDGRKVIVADTDHLWGIGGEVGWVWKSVTRGMNLLFMDPYDCSPYWPPYPCDSGAWEGLRRNLGYARAYGERLNLGQATPRAELCSTGWCLVDGSAGRAGYLVYQPQSGGGLTVDLSGVNGRVRVEWLNPDNGATSRGDEVSGGGVVSFTPPFPSSHGAVLLLQQVTPDLPTSTPTSTPRPTGTIPPITPTANLYLPSVEGNK